jgi:hypothetical protein
MSCNVPWSQSNFSAWSYDQRRITSPSVGWKVMDGPFGEELKKVFMERTGSQFHYMCHRYWA